MATEKLSNCPCLLFKKNKDLYYDAVKSAQLKLISSKTVDYEDLVELECNQCKRKWLFTRNDSFHAPIITWTEVR